MFAPAFALRINYKPLVPPAELERFRPDRILRRMKRQILKELKDKILQETFTPAAKKRLMAGMEVVVGPKSVTVRAKDPAFLPLLEGQSSGQMRWLTKAKRPIPIVTDSGKLIFRWATPRSMKNGSWYHPGRQPTTVLGRARKAARETVKAQIRKELVQHFKTSMGKKR